MKETEHYTPDELAAYLNCHRRTIDRWHALRKGPPRIKVGNLILYRRAAVNYWLQQHEQGGSR